MRRCRGFRRVFPPIVTFVIVVLVVEILVRGGAVASYLLPAPSTVAKTLVTQSQELGRATWETACATLVGFGMSVAGGVIAAIALSSAGWVRRAFYPYAIFFQTVPIIAIAPLLVIWFGYGMRTVIVSAFIVSIFPVIANTLDGLRSTDPALRDLFRLYGANRWATLWKLRLPAAMPQILTGMRIAAGLAVIGAIVGEFVGGGGLGGLVDIARTQQRTDKVFAALLLASALGLALFAGVGLASRLALRRWHPSERE